MKQTTRLLLALVCILCLLMAGCRSSQNAPVASSTQNLPAETGTTPTEAETGAPAETTQGTEPSKAPDDAAEIHPVETAGKTRLPYTGNRSSVQYITAPDQLPQQEGLEGYDAAYFEDHALLLIIETVGSGSVQVGVDTITIRDHTATVLLTHEMPGDVGTSDMATWLLWVEVEPGLDYQWVLENPAFPSDGQTQ